MKSVREKVVFPLLAMAMIAVGTFPASAILGSIENDWVKSVALACIILLFTLAIIGLQAWILPPEGK